LSIDDLLKNDIRVFHYDFNYIYTLLLSDTVTLGLLIRAVRLDGNMCKCGKTFICKITSTSAGCPRP